MRLKEFFELFASVAIIFAAAQIRVNRKQLFLSTIAKCVSDYRTFLDMTKSSLEVDKIKRYVDLCNEELFYFKHGYIPNKIAFEWVDGMINNLPLMDAGGKILNSERCLDYLIQNTDVLDHYPRILFAFEIKGRYDFGLIYDHKPENRKKRQSERKRLIAEIIGNNKRFEYF